MVITITKPKTLLQEINEFYYQVTNFLNISIFSGKKIEILYNNFEGIKFNYLPTKTSIYFNLPTKSFEVDGELENDWLQKSLKELWENDYYQCWLDLLEGKICLNVFDKKSLFSFIPKKNTDDFISISDIYSFLTYNDKKRFFQYLNKYPKIIEKINNKRINYLLEEINYLSKQIRKITWKI